MFDIITPPDHTPVSYGSGVIGLTPGIFTVSDARINAGNITETKLISTMLIENRNTIHGNALGLVCDSDFLSFDILFCVKLCLLKILNCNQYIELLG